MRDPHIPHLLHLPGSRTESSLSGSVNQPADGTGKRRPRPACECRQGRAGRSCTSRPTASVSVWKGGDPGAYSPMAN